MLNPFGGKAYPFVTISCRTCGNTHFINLLILGFSDKDWEALGIETEETNG